MSFLSLILTLLLIQDPFGNIPVCFSLLHPVKKERRIWILIRENLIALCISSTFLILGNSLFKYLAITPESLGITGGLILLVVAFKMIFSSSASSLAPLEQKEPFIVPLAMPLLAGPSMIARVALYASQYPHNLADYFLALCIVTLLSTIILLLAIPLKAWINTKALNAIEQLTGIFLMAMAIQMLLDNMHTYLNFIIQ